MDVILGDIAFTFPLTKAQYAGKDFIVWGNREAVLAGDTYNGASAAACLTCHVGWCFAPLCSCMRCPVHVCLLASIPACISQHILSLLSHQGQC